MSRGEHYNAKPMADGDTLNVGASIAGFLSDGAAALTITDADGTVLVDGLVMGAGFTRIPLFFRSSSGGTVACAGGAGTLFT
jgi:hypothetical protein